MQEIIDLLVFLAIGPIRLILCQLIFMIWKSQVDAQHVYPSACPGLQMPLLSIQYAIQAVLAPMCSANSALLASKPPKWRKLKLWMGSVSRGRRPKKAAVSLLKPCCDKTDGKQEENEESVDNATKVS